MGEWESGRVGEREKARMGEWEKRENGRVEKTEIQLPMPYSQCPIPNALFPIPYSQFPIPNSLFPIPYSQTFQGASPRSQSSFKYLYSRKVSIAKKKPSWR